MLLMSFPNLAAAQVIREVAAGNGQESYRIIIEGPFETGLAKRFERFMQNEHSLALTVSLNSGGGNLMEGLKLGLLFRKYGLWTTVERQKKSQEYLAELDDNAVCASACAMAFLGGKIRTLNPDAKLGYHQFYRTQSSERMIQDRLAENEISGEAQFYSALLAAYLTELGDIDLNLLLLAAEAGPDEMHWITQVEATELGITAKSGWSSFWLEPYKDGVVAASRRNDAMHGYDPLYFYSPVAQATALCRNGGKFLMLSAPRKVEVDPKNYDVEWSFWDATGRRINITERGGFTSRGDDNRGWLDISVSSRIANLIQRSEKFSAAIWFARVIGGYHGIKTKLTDQDKSMIDAAFRLCIS
ncbi:hypothetical protein OAI26_02035 [Sulfitobacter sp.]|nr:hypothetical protein [Sulfitobacter sp.]